MKQFVIYLGKKASKMPTKLAPEEVFTGFILTSVRDYSYQTLLASEVPEELILTILSDFAGEKPVEVIRRILSKLQELSREEIVLRKYIRQLSVLARLRNLTKETQRQIQDMALTYNITEDYLYQQGVEKGIEKGVEKGEKAKEKRLIIKMLKDKTLSLEKIAELAEVPVEYVKQIAEELNQ